MANHNDATIPEPLSAGKMVEADIIRVTPLSATAANLQSLRTVTTSMTTGSVSIRYVPRPTQSYAEVDTTN
jgi:hypothetical protein